MIDTGLSSSAAASAPGAGTTTGTARRALALTVAFAALWAVLEIALGASLRQPYDLMQVVWWRYATHLALLVAIFGWQRPSRLWRTERTALQLGRSLLMLVMPLSFAMSLSFGASPGFVWTGFWIAPLAILLLARWLLNERAPRLLWACSAFVPALAVVIHEPQVPAGVGALMLPLLMALSFSLYVIATRALQRERLLTNLFYTAFGVFVLLTPFMPHVWVWPTAHDALVLCGIGAIGLVALALLDRSVERNSASIVAPILGTHLLFGIVLSALHGGPVHRRDLLAIVLLAGMSALLWHRAAALHGEPSAPPPVAVEGALR